MFKTGPDILALAADMPEPATTEETSDNELSEEEVQEVQEVSEDVDGSEAPTPVVQPPAPVPSTKIGWAASLKMLEDAGQAELAAHAKRIQADATRKAQEAAQARREAEAMLAEAKALRASLSQPAAPHDPQEAVDPWDPAALRALAQREAKALLEAELAPLRAAREAEAQAAARARKEAELDAWVEAHPDFASDESMQEEVAAILQDAQTKGRFVHLDDAYTIVSARRQAGEQARLKAEAKARAEAKAKAASKSQAAARPQAAVPQGKTKPVQHMSAKEILELAKRG